MSASPARFVWYDLMTTDKDAAATFYKKVHGWNTRDSGVPGKNYTVLSVGDIGIGGIMALGVDAGKSGARPGWIGYIGVPDVDASTAEVVKAGGHVHHAPEDIEGVGRFAVVADPQGAAFILFRGDGIVQPPAPMGTPGHVGWHELHAVERQSAFDFYAGQFGWTKGVAHEMGPNFIYQLFATGREDEGGMMTKMPEMPVAAWLYYFNVESVNEAVARVKDAGGQLVNGPHQVPGGIWIAQCIDPQGAMFALTGPKL